MDHTSETENPMNEAKVREPWNKPEIKVLPVEQTHTASSTGNDGNGTFTQS
ncbi:hypothetical protein [Rhizorhabdus sp. FW153]|uniref:hypothetical protein n=1 Tax=Rhizorhabdus sp. FW153 TaxID=3400216 RepID=UPI003CEF277A